MRIRHIINPVAVTPKSDLFIAQPITFTSLHIAQIEALKKNIKVDLCYTCYPEDLKVAPKRMRNAGILTRSILDVSVLKKPRKLPLITDIINKTIEGYEVDFIIYTNIDISVQPHFYTEIVNLINKGYDGFAINRRTLSQEYNLITQLDQMYQDKGSLHPGHDCFIFSYHQVKKFKLGHTCIGANWVGRVILTNLMTFSNQFKIFENEFLTFHLGDDRVWNNDKLNDYEVHNEKELIKILKTLITLCKTEQVDKLKEIYQYHQHRCIITPRIIENKINSNYPDDINKLLGNSYKMSINWITPILLNQSPIFIVGYPRSGTTLIQSKLMTQINIISLAETHFFSKVMSYLEINKDKVLLMSLDKAIDCLRECLPLSLQAENHLKKLSENNQLSPKMMFEAIIVDNLLSHYKVAQIKNARFIEKTPDHVKKLEMIAHYYPGLKIINMIRNPKKAVLSIKKHFFQHQYWDIEEHINNWKSSVEAAENFPFKDKIITVKLEDLIDNETSTMKNICDFIGIPFDKSQLSNATEKAKQVSQPWELWKLGNQQQIKDYQLGQKKYLMDAEELQLMENLIHDKLISYGYSP